MDFFELYPDVIETAPWFQGHSHMRGFAQWQYQDGSVLRTIEQARLKQQEALMRMLVPIQCDDPFWAAAIEPNLPVPITSFGEAYCYKWRILHLRRPNSTFKLLVSIQIHTGTTPATIEATCQGFSNYWQQERQPEVFGKLYMAEVTNSSIGVQEADLFSEPMLANFAEMERQRMVLQVHPEVFCGKDNYFDCEGAFIPLLQKLAEMFPDLKISVEHIGTEVLLNAVLALPDNVTATFTIHGLLGDTADFWRDGKIYDPFNFCRSILRTSADRMALIQAIINPVSRRKLSLGLDDAAHLSKLKIEKKSPGIWIPGWAAASHLLEIGEANNIPLEAIIEVACLNGPRVYDLKIPNRKIRFERSEVMVPEIFPVDEVDGVVPYKPGHVCQWQVVRN